MTPEEDEQSGCKLLDSFAIFVQLVLATLAFSTLIIKRQRELPQRPLLIWSFDVSKQLIGGIVIHSLNLIASHLFGKSLDGEPESNPCVWYFLNIFVDTTLGVLIIWGVLSTVTTLANYYVLSGFESGVYGDPPVQNQIKIWLRQLGVYILALVTMKVLVLILFGICPWLEDFGEWVLGWTKGNYRLQVLFVMLIFPLVMNIVQFWIVDTIVKHKTIIPIRLDSDEELAQDLLISDGDYLSDAEEVETFNVHQRPSSVSDESLYELRTSANAK